MGDILLQIIWVAAHHELRRRSVRDRKNLYDQRYWRHVHDITTVLGNPPAPGGSS